MSKGTNRAQPMEKGYNKKRAYINIVKSNKTRQLKVHNLPGIGSKFNQIIILKCCWSLTEVSCRLIILGKNRIIKYNKHNKKCTDKNE